MRFNYFVISFSFSNKISFKYVLLILGHLETVKALVELGANVTIKSFAGQTPRDMAKRKFINVDNFCKIECFKM